MRERRSRTGRSPPAVLTPYALTERIGDLRHQPFQRDASLDRQRGRERADAAGRRRQPRAGEADRRARRQADGELGRLAHFAVTRLLGRETAEGLAAAHAQGLKEAVLRVESEAPAGGAFHRPPDALANIGL